MVLMVSIDLDAAAVDSRDLEVDPKGNVIKADTEMAAVSVSRAEQGGKDPCMTVAVSVTGLMRSFSAVYIGLLEVVRRTEVAPPADGACEANHVKVNMPFATSFCSGSPRYQRRWLPSA